MLSEQSSPVETSSPRATPRELLEKIAQQNTPRALSASIPGTPSFFVNGFARPNPGQALM